MTTALSSTDDPLPTGVCLYLFDVFPDGTGRRVAEKDVKSPLSAGAAYRWIHVDIRHPDSEALILDLTDLTVARALRAEDTRPRVTPHDDGLLVILRGVNLNPGSDPEDMVSIRMFIKDGLVLSCRIRRLMAIVGLREAIEDGRGPTDVASFVVKLAEGLTERMDVVIGDLADEVDELEDRSLDEVTGLRQDVAEIRRAAIGLRRYIAPQREALFRLDADNVDFLDRDNRISIRESVERITRMVEELDAIRERAGVISDQLADRRAEEMNRNMMILSIVAAIFLPLGFLTGLLGINVGGIPLANSALGFPLVCALSVAIGGGLILYFRSLKWL